MNHKVYFIAGLSNGETITEGKGAYTVTTGELSPWQRLLSYIEKNNLHITSLSLAAADGRRWNLPSAGKNPKFHAIESAQKPVKYVFFRKAAANMQMKSDGTEVSEQGEWGDVHTCAEAVYENGTSLQVWVNEESLASWSFVA